MKKLLTIIWVSLFLNVACFQKKIKEDESKLSSSPFIQAKIPKLTFLKAEGFFQTANFKVVHQITGCFQYKARTITFKKLTNGFYVASYSEYNGSEWTGEYLTRNLNGDFISEFDKFVEQCKQMQNKIWEITQVETKGNTSQLHSFGPYTEFSTNQEKITIDDGLHYKTYSINNKAGANPFNVFMQRIFFKN